jgi:hypothetical protein
MPAYNSTWYQILKDHNRSIHELFADRHIYYNEGASEVLSLLTLCPQLVSRQVLEVR